MKEYNSEMKVSAIKNDLRSSMVAELKEFLKSKYETVEMVGSNKIGVVAGVYTDEDGFAHDMAIVVQATVKNFYDKASEKENGRDVVAYDLYEEAETYKFEQESKESKKSKKEETE